MTTAGKVKPPEDFFKTQMKRDEFDEDDDDTGVEPLISLSFKGIQVRCIQTTEVTRDTDRIDPPVSSPCIPDQSE